MVRIIFDPDDKEGSVFVQTVGSVEINITAIQYEERPGFEELWVDAVGVAQTFRLVS